MRPMPATLPAGGESIWGEISRGEIALFVVGVVFTIALLVTFVLITFRHGRDEPGPSGPVDRG